MTGAMSRRKGADFERWLSRRMREAFPHLDIKRGLLQSRDGRECPDVEMPMLWLEAKRGRKPNVRAALRQASEATDGRIPVAVIRDDGAKPFVVLDLEDFISLLVHHG